ncbi:hypothetical protein F2P44_27270 [Massilia sp. CCM 8695]|uniref:DUF541 domain-containing protein n=1 Tax=Massilia frigida TaxID=2609281 RepID=A0ABX0NF09_9BURK|nr:MULTISPECIES: hypothetical protein [Massilia]MDM5176376.1 hypothetical protein [Massilia sp. DJPM01]NHZ82948.1 hypothetical protein [Massilia frigida]
MNIVKNMEAVLIAAVALTFVTAMASAEAPRARSAAPTSPAAAAKADTDMTTIVVTGKRLSAAEKAKQAA